MEALGKEVLELPNGIQESRKLPPTARSPMPLKSPMYDLLLGNWRVSSGDEVL